MESENCQPFLVDLSNFTTREKKRRRKIRRSIGLINPIKIRVDLINSIKPSSMKLLCNQTGESLPLRLTFQLPMSRGTSSSHLRCHIAIHHTSPIIQSHLVAELTCATLVADAFGDAIVVNFRASNVTGIASIFNDQPGWNKDSIMAITFGILGTILGVAAVWVGAQNGMRRYRERTPFFSRVVGWEMVGRGVSDS
jgi:hypothetical protein